MSIDKIHDDVEQGHEQDERLDRARILGHQRGDRVVADTRPGEHALDHRVAGHQEAEDDAQDGHERDQRVGQRIAVDHAPRRNAGRPGGLDVVGLEDFEHRRAHHAGDRRHDAEAEREGGQHELMQRRAAAPSSCR